jgi:hypothetical protein
MTWQADVCFMNGVSRQPICFLLEKLTFTERSGRRDVVIKTNICNWKPSSKIRGLILNQIPRFSGCIRELD